jgi:hypothetical protein
MGIDVNFHTASIVCKLGKYSVSPHTAVPLRFTKKSPLLLMTKRLGCVMASRGNLAKIQFLLLTKIELTNVRNSIHRLLILFEPDFTASANFPVAKVL